MSSQFGARDLYAVLEVPRTASDGDIKKAYRTLAKKYHPDVCPDDKAAEEKFKDAANAYQVLSDKEMRAAYDRFGLDGLRRGGVPGAGPPDTGAPTAGTRAPFEGFKNVDDIFSAFGNLFGEFFAQRATRSTRGPDLRVELRLAFHEAVWGTRREVKLTRTASCVPCNGTGASRGGRVENCNACQGKGQVNHAQGFFMVQTTCGRCHGRGKMISAPCTSCHGQGVCPETSTLMLTVPPGVSDEQTLRVTGKGECVPGGGPGDLYVDLCVERDERFTREKDDVASEVLISFARAALGGEVEIDTLDDNCRGTAILELSPGTQPDDLVVRRDQGIPHLEGQGRGDHLIRFRVEVPKKLSDKQAKILREFAAELGEELGEKSRRPKKRRSR
jgi:molecular chaperone DnaJ